MEFDQIQNLIDSVERDRNASELHGLVCGYICAGSRWRKEDWYRNLQGWFETPSLPGDLHARLTPVAEWSLLQLEDDSLGFGLLLPDGNQSLSLRAWAISGWCRGFLEGFGLAGKHDQQSLSPDVAELLHDLAEISQMDDQLDSQDSESDFYQVEEYVRMGAILIFTEYGQVHQDPK
jgi:uncharacterized protein YgfB (UPF0149 family)